MYLVGMLARGFGFSLETHTQKKEDKVKQSVVINAFDYIEKCFWTWENTLWNEFVHYKLRDNDVHSSTCEFSTT